MDRMNGIFRDDGRTVIIALDHGVSFGPIAGLENPLDIARTVVAEGADAFLTTLGFAKKYHDELAGVPFIIRIDGGATIIGPKPHNMRRLFHVEEAIRLGARGVIAMGFLGTEGESESLKDLAEVSTECLRLEVPLIAEMLPVEPEGVTNPDWVALAARVGADLGADIVKVNYTGDSESFKKVVQGCFVPVVVRGGPRMSNDEEVLETVRGALAGGAAGIAFGRNVWQRDNVAEMTRLLVKAVHG